MSQIRIKTEVVIIFMALVYMFTGCSSNDQNGANQDLHEDQTEHTHGREEAGDHNPSGLLHRIRDTLSEDEVLITEKQMKTADIALGTITRQELSQLVKSFGELALAPSDEARVSAVIGGVCRDLRIIEGDYVKKGQVIARISHPDIVDMQQRYLEALNRDEYLESEYKRQKRLLEDSVNSEKTFQNAKSDYQSNLTRLQSLRQKLELIHIDTDQLSPQTLQKDYPVVAPISGYIARINVNTGSHVSPQQPLFHITANDKVHIDLNVYEKDMSKIAQGQNLTFKLANKPATQPMKGKIMKVAKRFDSGQRTALVHAEILEKSEDLLPGMAVMAHIQTGGKKQMTLPEEAFVAEQGEDYTFLLKKEGVAGQEHKEHAHNEGENQHTPELQNEQDSKNNHEHVHDDSVHYFIFERVLVNKGMTEGSFTSFTFDIPYSANDRFVINNAQALVSEMKKGGSGHSGHAH
ncbi:MAG: efflux RND transporter periplasmic adaptor subunit [Bacteroidales bacterium]|nr:efflux RND transporter periplasmic adaptor subunit [Bacteroidales bacterium]